PRLERRVLRVREVGGARAFQAALARSARVWFALGVCLERRVGAARDGARARASRGATAKRVEPARVLADRRLGALGHARAPSQPLALFAARGAGRGRAARGPATRAAAAIHRERAGS